MIRRDRQGWRVLIVLSRLAVAGILVDAGPPGFTRTQNVYGQTAPPKSPHPPPPPVPPQRNSAKASSDGVAPAKVAPEQPPGPEALNTPAAEPTPAARFASPIDAPPQIVLPIPPSLEQLTAERNSLNQFLFRDRRHQLLLTRGDRALSSGDVNLALMHYQALVDATTDAFYWPQDSLTPRGAQSSAQFRLRSLPWHAREVYERRYGAEAGALLHEALNQGDRRLLLEVLQRFRLTVAAREAMLRELLFAYDRGQILRAVQFAQMLAEDPDHRQHLPPPVRSLVDRLRDHAHRQSRASLVGAAPLSEATSPPALRPRWGYSLGTSLSCGTVGEDWERTEGLSRLVEEAMTRWLHEHEHRQLPIATANQATVVGDLLLIRDFTGIQALDLSTGKSVWSFRCATSLANAAEQCLREEAHGGGSPPLSFHAHFAGQGAQGRLTADSQRLYFIDGHKQQDRSAVKDEDGAAQRISNRLMALKLAPPEPSPDQDVSVSPQIAWVGGATRRTNSDPLAGHFFLGPPLPVEGRLFVLSEFDRRVHCAALNAQTGELLWQQPIALVEQPVDWDNTRQQMACTPVSVGSVIVCPTEVGVIVGVDSLTGTLGWIYDHIDDDQRHAAGRWSSSSQRSFGSTEFPSRMLAGQGRIYYLPIRSRYVHCINASTGTLIWKRERRDASGLSAIANGHVILTGSRNVLALSTDDGSLQWDTTCPEPAGHGLVAGPDFLLPIRDGRCLSLSVSDGTITGSRFGKLLHELSRPPAQRPTSGSSEIQLVAYEQEESPNSTLLGLDGGNLLAADECIVVSTPTSVIVYPQAQPLLQTLTADLAHGGFAPQHDLEAAMLQLRLGDMSAAKDRLHRLLTSAAAADVQQKAIRLLREILFQELAVAADPRPILDELATMPASGPDELRLLVGRIDAELKLGSPQRLADALDEIRNADLQAPISPDSESEYFVQASSYVADRLALASSSANGTVRSALEEYVSLASAEVASSGDTQDRESLLALFPGWPQVADLRNDLAEAYLEAGHMQQAELLLLMNRPSPNRTAAARARRLLAELYSQQGLQWEAAANLAELDAEYQLDSTGVGLTGGEYAQQIPQDHPVWQIVNRRRSAAETAYQVRITEHICDEDCEAAAGCRSAGALIQHDRIRRKFLLDDETTLTVIDRGIVPGDRNHSQLTLVSRETGGVHAEFRFPAAYWQLSGCGDRRCGQFLPTCGRTAIGLSLLEQRPIWSTEESGAGHTRDKVKLGPLGTDYCVLQSPRRLWVVHPGTGDTLWQRDSLPPNMGLLADETSGIIGDSETLIVFGPDQKTYTVYRMRSGCEVRHGQLDISSADARRYRQAIGSRLVHLITRGEQELLRIWDAATDEVRLEIPLRDHLYCRIGQSSQYALITPEGRLVIFDVNTGRVDLDIPVSEEHLQGVTDLAVAADRDHYFVNLVGCTDDDSTATAAATDEVEVPHMRVQGHLMAISKLGRVLWRQTVADAVLLTNSKCSLPVLTLISRVRDPQSRQTSRLRMDVLDTRSGELLARRDDLLRTRIVQSNYHHRPGQLVLVGLNSQIRIDFGPRRRDLLIHAELDKPESTSLR